MWPINLDRVAPSLRPGEEQFHRLKHLMRAGISPSAVPNFVRAWDDLDIRDLLPTLSVPVLVLHRTGDRLREVGMSRYLAEHIPGAKLVALPGEDHLFWLGDADRVIDEIEEFITGQPPRPDPDRVLATVLYTDIVSSTDRAVAEGDRGWRALLDRHDEIVRAELGRFRGTAVKNTGDGVLATFDGPARAVRCALAIRESLGTLGRAGYHVGDITIRRDDVTGSVVNVASRLCELAEDGSIFVSGGRPARPGGFGAHVRRARCPRAQGHPRQLGALRGRVVTDAPAVGHARSGDPPSEWTRLH